MIDVDMITYADVRAALHWAKGKVAILPVPLPLGASLYPFVSYSQAGDWRVILRLCSFNRKRSGGAVLTVNHKGISVTQRIKRASRTSLRNALQRACIALYSLHRLAAHRTNVMEICDNYTGRVTASQARGSESRKRQADLMRLARKLTMLRGYESITFSNWSIPVCEEIAYRVSLRLRDDLDCDLRA
jgi:hypothetical protein